MPNNTPVTDRNKATAHKNVVSNSPPLHDEAPEYTTADYDAPAPLKEGAILRHVLLSGILITAATQILFNPVCTCSPRYTQP